MGVHFQSNPAVEEAARIQTELLNNVERDVEQTLSASQVRRQRELYSKQRLYDVTEEMDDEQWRRQQREKAAEPLAVPLIEHDAVIVSATVGEVITKPTTIGTHRPGPKSRTKHMQGVDDSAKASEVVTVAATVGEATIKPTTSASHRPGPKSRKQLIADYAVTDDSVKATEAAPQELQHTPMRHPSATANVVDAAGESPVYSTQPQVIAAGASHNNTDESTDEEDLPAMMRSPPIKQSDKMTGRRSTMAHDADDEATVAGYQPRVIDDDINATFVSIPFEFDDDADRDPMIETIAAPTNTAEPATSIAKSAEAPVIVQPPAVKSKAKPKKKTTTKKQNVTSPSTENSGR